MKRVDAIETIGILGLLIATFKWYDVFIWVWVFFGLWAMMVALVHNLHCPNNHYGFRCIRR